MRSRQIPLKTGARFAAFVAMAGVLSFRPAASQGQAPGGSADEPIRGMIGVGTWRTQAEYRDIKVTKGDRTLYSSDFSNGLEGWKTLRGQWQAVDGALRQTGNEEDSRALFGDPGWSDYTLTLRARKLGGGEGFLVLFGVPDESAKSWWNLGGWSNTAHALEAPGISRRQVPGSIETGRWYDVRIELEGNTVRAYLDGRLVQSANRAPRTHTVEFSTEAPGRKMALTEWGLDTAWASEDNMRRGLAYMGMDNVDMVRVSFPINEPLVDGDLPASKDAHFTTRLGIAGLAGDRPFTMLPDTEAGVHPWYKDGNDVNPERWVQLMAASQKRYGKKMMAVEAFNEADYGWGQGSARNLNDILGALRKSPDFAGVQLGGPSTLNSDAALRWYEAIRDRLQRGTTHSLGGTFDSYVDFYRQVAADGKVLDNPEVHNLAEVIAGAEYGLQSAIWWGTAELARGEFVKASGGERLAYAEDGPRWSAAAVYRAPGGKVQAFLGSSERLGDTTEYRFVSRDRPVFFNGDGPRREFTVAIRKDTEYLVNITWGEDVPPPVGGRYILLNRQTGKVLEVADAGQADGAALRQADYTGQENQQWEVAPFVGPYGDHSYFTVRALHSGKALDLAGRSYADGGGVQQRGDGRDVGQHWYFDYAGDNCFTIRSRWSTKCLEVAGGSRGAGAAVVQASPAGAARQKWRLIPVSGLGEGTTDLRPPRRPEGLTASASPGGVALRWKAGGEADLAGYDVLRSTKPGGPYETIARGVQGDGYADDGAAEPRAFYYVIRAVDRSLNRSALSSEAVGRPGGE